MRSNISWLLNSPIAHRGLHNKQKNIPENSMASFAKAISANIPIEIDIHLTKDEEIIVFHDYDLKRMVGIDKKTKDLKLIELVNHQLSNTNENIPSLTDFLALVDGKVPILIEIKDHTNIGLLEKKLLTILNGYKGQFAIQAFDPKILKWLKNKAPNIIRGQLTRTYKGEKLPIFKKLRLRMMVDNFLTKPDFVAVQIDMLSDISLKYWKIIGMPILVWTIRSKDDELKTRHRADNIIFEGYLPDGYEFNKRNIR